MKRLFHLLPALLIATLLLLASCAQSAGPGTQGCPGSGGYSQQLTLSVEQQG